MAEGLVNYTRLDDPDERIFTTQGRPMSPDDEVWVADENGNPLPRGETGRLMTRGPYTFRGYYNSPEHNASAFDENGFYCSGDLVAIDEQGYITVQGREKDQINRGGEKIAAEEIENLLLGHEAIVHAGLVSMEDSRKKLRVYRHHPPGQGGGDPPLFTRAGRRRFQTAGSRGARRCAAAHAGRQSG